MFLNNLFRKTLPYMHGSQNNDKDLLRATYLSIKYESKLIILIVSDIQIFEIIISMLELKIKVFAYGKNA